MFCVSTSRDGDEEEIHSDGPTAFLFRICISHSYDPYGSTKTASAYLTRWSWGWVFFFFYIYPKHVGNKPEQTALVLLCAKGQRERERRGGEW